MAAVEVLKLLVALSQTFGGVFPNLFHFALIGNPFDGCSIRGWLIGWPLSTFTIPFTVFAIDQRLSMLLFITTTTSCPIVLCEPNEVQYQSEDQRDHHPKRSTAPLVDQSDQILGVPHKGGPFAAIARVEGREIIGQRKVPGEKGHEKGQKAQQGEAKKEEKPFEQPLPRGLFGRWEAFVVEAR